MPTKGDRFTRAEMRCPGVHENAWPFGELRSPKGLCACAQGTARGAEDTVDAPVGLWHGAHTVHSRWNSVSEAQSLTSGERRQAA